MGSERDADRLSSAAPRMERLTDFAEIRKIYRRRLRRDFARNERKPLSAIRRALARDEYACWGLFEEGWLRGYAFFVKLDREGRTDYLFDYLAIDRERRDAGWGTVFLQKLAEQFSERDCVIGEVDDPDRAPDERERALRERRMRFYLRNGCVDTGITSTVFGADYRILELPRGPLHSPEEVRAIYDGVYRHIFPPAIYRNHYEVRGG